MSLCQIDEIVKIIRRFSETIGIRWDRFDVLDASHNEKTNDSSRRNISEASVGLYLMFCMAN